MTKDEFLALCQQHLQISVRTITEDFEACGREYARPAIVVSLLFKDGDFARVLDEAKCPL